MTDSGKLYTRMQEEISALACSINEIVGRFRALHNPLTESQQRVPMATEQLDKISRQTEAAAHQMLDRVERITQREEEMMAGLKTLRERVVTCQLDGAGQLIDTLVEKANTNYNDAYLIMDSLQFQDITAQQMNHAASLLEDIETRLVEIVTVIQGREEEGTAGRSTEKGRSRAFDPHADLSDKRTVQEDIDNLFAKRK